MDEIPNNHLGCIGCIKPLVSNGINYQPQLVIAGFIPSTSISSMDENQLLSCDDLAAEGLPVGPRDIFLWGSDVSAKETPW